MFASFAVGGLLLVGAMLYVARQRPKAELSRETLVQELEQARTSLRLQQDTIRRLHGEIRTLERLAVQQQRRFYEHTKVVQRLLDMHAELIGGPTLTPIEAEALEMLRAVLESTETPAPPH